MKKFISIAMILVMCASLSACGGDSDSKSSDSKSSSQSSVAAAKTPSEKAEDLLSAVEFPSMVSQDMDYVEATFGITSDLVSEHVVYVCGSAAMPDEFGIFAASSDDAAATIKEKLENRIAYQKETYTTYTPDEVYKLDDSFVEVNGKTVIYAICADNTKAREILG